MTTAADEARGRASAGPRQSPVGGFWEDSQLPARVARRGGGCARGRAPQSIGFPCVRQLGGPHSCAVARLRAGGRRRQGGGADTPLPHVGEASPCPLGGRVRRTRRGLAVSPRPVLECHADPRPPATTPHGQGRPAGAAAAAVVGWWDGPPRAPAGEKRRETLAAGQPRPARRQRHSATAVGGVGVAAPPTRGRRAPAGGGVGRRRPRRGMPGVGVWWACPASNRRGIADGARVWRAAPRQRGWRRAGGPVGQAAPRAACGEVGRTPATAATVFGLLRPGAHLAWRLGDSWKRATTPR